MVPEWVLEGRWQRKGRVPFCPGRGPGATALHSDCRRRQTDNTGESGKEVGGKDRMRLSVYERTNFYHGVIAAIYYFIIHAGRRRGKHLSRNRAEQAAKPAESGRTLSGMTGRHACTPDEFVSQLLGREEVQEFRRGVAFFLVYGEAVQPVFLV